MKEIIRDGDLFYTTGFKIIDECIQLQVWYINIK